MIISVLLVIHLVTLMIVPLIPTKKWAIFTEMHVAIYIRLLNTWLCTTGLKHIVIIIVIQIVLIIQEDHSQPNVQRG